MPEGPEIRRIADQLTTALAGQKVTQLYFAFAKLKKYQSRLKGVRIKSVEARGKALLSHFENGYTIYSHNQLYGRWFITPKGEKPDSQRQLRLAIHTAQQTAWLYSASEIVVLKADELANHPYLSRLGPDLLDAAMNIETVVARLAEQRFRRRGLIRLLQDQQVLSGMGNYLCCEALHLSRLHPQTRPADLSARQLRALAKNCLHLIRQSYRTGGITNDLQRAKRLRKQGSSFEASRFYVYRRQAQPCYQCGTLISKVKMGGSPVYYCASCQPPV